MTDTLQHHAAMKKFRRQARDLLGLIRIENSLLDVDGQLTVEGLYLHKMSMLQELDEAAQVLSASVRESEAVALSKQVQMLAQDLKQLRDALSENTRQHLKNALGAGLPANDQALEHGVRPWH
jgi:hypothetical protein